MQIQQDSISDLVTHVSKLRAEISELNQDVSTERWVLGRDRYTQLDQSLLGGLARIGALFVDAITDGTLLELMSSITGHVPLERPKTGEAPPKPQTLKITPDQIATPEPAEITDDIIAALQEKISGGGAFFKDDEILQKSPLSAAMVRSTLKVLGQTPPTLNTKKERQKEWVILSSACNTQLVKWRRVDRTANREMTYWLVTRLRALQVASGVDPKKKSGFNRLFGLIRRHISQSEMGQIHGLARAHQPIGATWTRDAQNCEDEVRALITEDSFNRDNALRVLTEQVQEGMEPDAYCEAVLELFKRGVSKKNKRLVRLSIPYLADLNERFSELKKAIHLEIDERCAEDLTRPLTIPKDWPCFDRTQGRSAVIVGGDTRPDRAKRLKQEFGFSRLDWIDPKAGNKVDSLVQKMRNGTVDLVIVLRAFSSHTVSDKVFANRDCCLVVLADTYGVNQVRLGIERFVRPAGYK